MYNLCVSIKERILTWLFLLIGLVNILRAAMGLYLMPVLFNVPQSLSVVWWTGCYLVWGGVFIMTALRRRWHIAPWAWRLFLIYQGWSWCVSLLFDRSSYAYALWGRDVLFSVLSVLVVWVLTRPARLN